MPPSSTTQFVIDSIQALSLLEGRFEQIRLVNINSANGQRRGCFSLVFRALDITSGEWVALKFFDPDSLLDTYRLLAFRREHEILDILLGTERCLQLACPLRRMELAVPNSPVRVKCEYFAVEWIDEEIDEYFLCQERHSAIEKLHLYRSIAASVESLHSRGIFHRDLKIDNLRRGKAKGHVVAIDLGTAATLSSQPIAIYGSSVGASGYASPEARCGLAGNRLLAKYTDFYSLGCMLFELFNPDFHFRAFYRANPYFNLHMAALAQSVDRAGSEKAQQIQWDEAIRKLRHTFTPVHINGAGSDIPPGVGTLLDELLQGLTNYDYKLRPSFSVIRHRLASAIKVVENEKLYHLRLARAKALRARRLQKLEQRQIKILRLRNSEQTC